MNAIIGTIISLSFICGCMVYDPSYEDYKQSKKSGKIYLVILYTFGIVGLVYCYILETIICCIKGIFYRQNKQ